MRLIDFQITMEELGLKVNENTVSFCDLDITYLDGRCAISPFKKIPGSLKSNYLNHNDKENNEFFLYDKTHLIKFIIDLSLIYKKKYLLKRGALCSLESVLIDTNCRMYDLIASNTVSSRTWLDNHQLIYSKTTNGILDEQIRTLLDEFDNLVNPFASNKYSALFPFAYSNNFIISSSDDANNYVKCYPCFKISHTGNDVISSIHYCDISSSEQKYDKTHQMENYFCPSLKYSFDYDNKKDNVSIQVIHAFGKALETLWVTAKIGEVNLDILFDVNTGMKKLLTLETISQNLSEEEKQIIINALTNAISKLKRILVGYVCTPKRPILDDRQLVNK